MNCGVGFFFISLQMLMHATPTPSSSNVWIK